MGDTSTLGQFELLVLTAILAEGENAYGVTIHTKTEALSEREVKLGAVYATLDRLEDKGLLRSWLSDPTPERGGRSKRYFKLERTGIKALQEAALTAKRIYDEIEKHLGEDLWGPAARKQKSARIS